MGASGPGAINLVTGVAHARADCTPVIALGGASPDASKGRGAFQEIDQLPMFEPCTKWSTRVHSAKRIPEIINRAFREAMGGKPGPVYIDLPGDVLYEEVDENKIDWPDPWDPTKRSRPAGDPAQIKQTIELLKNAKQPVIISGTGIMWSDAAPELQKFVEAAGIPFYTTPQSRGVIPEDHDYCYLTARSTAFREADLIMVMGTRMNYIIGHAAPPRFNADAKIVRVDIDPDEIAGSPRKLDVPGEDQGKVVYKLLDPDRYEKQAVLVVGGGNSAVESALMLSEVSGTTVRLSYRGTAFRRVAPETRERLERFAAEGKVELLMSTTVTRIDYDAIHLTGPGGDISVPADVVLVQIGGTVPTAFLRKVGVLVDVHHGRKVIEGDAAEGAAPA